MTGQAEYPEISLGSGNKTVRAKVLTAGKKPHRIRNPRFIGKATALNMDQRIWHRRFPPKNTIHPTMHQLVKTNRYGETPKAVSNPVQSRLNFEQRTKTPIEMNQDAISL